MNALEPARGARYSASRMIPRLAVILAAGVGSRLRPLTDERPKCLVSVGEETILGRAMRLLREAGVARFVISTGYGHDAVRAALAHEPGVTLVHNPDYASTQNVVSLARALRQVRAGESFVKLDGDLLFTRRVLDGLFARTAGAAAAAVDRSGALGDEEMKVLVEDGQVRRFGKNIDPSAAHGESIGMECFGSEVAAFIAHAMERALAQGRTGLYYEDVYNEVLAPQGPVRMACEEVSPSEWTEVDDAHDLARANEMFAGMR